MTGAMILARQLAQSWRARDIETAIRLLAGIADRGEAEDVIVALLILQDRQ